jgi:hypothetical protein
MPEPTYFELLEEYMNARWATIAKSLDQLTEQELQEWRERQLLNWLVSGG